MPDLALHALPAELQAALAHAWPGCPEAQRRALLAPDRLGGVPVWPGRLWAWRQAGRWWRPFAARQERLRAQGLFSTHLGDARGEPWGAAEPVYPQRLFDPAQPFFATPWTAAEVTLRSPAPEVFSDADFWVITQRLWGGHVPSATATALGWARAMQAEGAVHGRRRARWLDEAQWRLHMSAAGTYL